jgi:hypothetical protein
MREEMGECDKTEYSVTRKLINISAMMLQPVGLSSLVHY